MLAGQQKKSKTPPPGKQETNNRIREDRVHERGDVEMVPDYWNWMPIDAALSGRALGQGRLREIASYYSWMEKETGGKSWREPSRTWFISQWRDQINEIRTLVLYAGDVLTFHISFAYFWFSFLVRQNLSRRPDDDDDAPDLLLMMTLFSLSRPPILTAKKKIDI